MRRLLVVVAHPDDESFGPGGTLAKYGHEKDVEIHLLCATRGEAGQWDEESKGTRQDTPGAGKELNLHVVREQELLRSAKILGIKKVEFLNYKDGTLNNNLYHELAEKIIRKIDDFKPHVILTIEQRGVSGHIDHVVISMTTTYAYLKTSVVQKLYYHCIPKEMRNKAMDNYFIYFPEGYDQKDITTRIDYSDVWDIKKQAMAQHLSQLSDVNRILKFISDKPKVDHFILQYYRGIHPEFPETDLFNGISPR